MKQNTFCKALSNAVSFRVPGDSDALTFNPCCLYNDYLPFHPTFFKRERDRFINAKTFLPGCSKCELKEKTHGNSLRMVSNNEIPDDAGDSIYKLEIVLDTTCNAACIQCGDSQSSLWRKELAQDKKIIHIQPEPEIDRKIKTLKESIDLNKVKIFHFWGGEPLLTDTHLKFLYEIENPADVQINYTTNCSIFPNDSVLKLWEKFKQVKIGLSIDGVGDQFHYIRWPLKWDKATRNLELFKNNTTRNTSFHINCCIIPLNVYYVDILGNWLDENFSTNPDGSRVSYNFIRGEGTLDIGCTPMSLREEIWKKLDDSHPISKVMKEIPVLDYKDMLSHINKWDPIRKLDWTQTFKEIVPHFKY
jgi:sulfatase maturation enzyme AslB (radical SAM superfamily)